MAISRAVVSLVAILLPVQVSVAQSGRAPQQQHPPVKRVRVDLSGFDLGKQQPAGTQTGGGSRGGQKSSITLNAPRKGLAYTTHPVFQWQDSEQTREAVFRIFDASGDELFESTVPGRSLAYPEDAPEFDRPENWTVSANCRSRVPDCGSSIDFDSGSLDTARRVRWIISRGDRERAGFLSPLARPRRQARARAAAR